MLIPFALRTDRFATNHSEPRNLVRNTKTMTSPPKSPSSIILITQSSHHTSTKHPAAFVVGPTTLWTEEGSRKFKLPSCISFRHSSTLPSTETQPLCRSASYRSQLHLHKDSRRLEPLCL